MEKRPYCKVSSFFIVRKAFCPYASKRLALAVKGCLRLYYVKQGNDYYVNPDLESRSKRIS